MNILLPDHGHILSKLQRLLITFFIIWITNFNLVKSLNAAMDHYNLSNLFMLFIRVLFLSKLIIYYQ